MTTISGHLSMGKFNNGDLGPIWMAAHFPKRINKQLVQQTSISSSVDKILVDHLHVTYRILGYLLLGVTRIYSKKVEYLLVDCNHSLNELKFFSEGRKKVDVNFVGMCLPESSGQRSKLKSIDVNSPESSRRMNCNILMEAMRAQLSSISLPENFELDAFDLQIVEDDSDRSSNDHVKPHLELVLCDALENYPMVPHITGKDHASASTSAMITNVNPEASVERFRHGLFLEERLDPMVLSETDEELVMASSPLIEQEQELSNGNNNNNNNNTDSSDMMTGDLNNSDKHTDEECTTTAPTVVSEMTSVDNITLKPSPNKSQLTAAVDVTPQSKASVVSGERRSERIAVRTPAYREPARASRKRKAYREPARASPKGKAVYDYPIVVPNEVYGTWVTDASDLVRKRRAPAAIVDQKQPWSFNSVLQPIIPIDAGFKSDHGSVKSTNKVVAVEEAQDTVEPINSKIDELGPLNLHQASKETETEVIAPLTPATQSASIRFNDIHESSKVNQTEPTSSCESGERLRFPIRDVDLVEIQQEKGPSSLGEENQENVADAETAVTKSVGGYLYSNFVHKKERGEEESLNLSQLLKHKTREESARFFYQMLVLKTRGYIDVNQEKAYGEICVKQTPKLNVFVGGSRD